MSFWLILPDFLHVISEQIMSSVNKDNFKSYFSICILSFPFLVFALARTYSRMLKKMVRGNILALLLVLAGKILFSFH